MLFHENFDKESPLPPLGTRSINVPKYASKTSTKPVKKKKIPMTNVILKNVLFTSRTKIWSYQMKNSMSEGSMD